MRPVRGGARPPGHRGQGPGRGDRVFVDAGLGRGARRGVNLGWHRLGSKGPARSSRPGARRRSRRTARASFRARRRPREAPGGAGGGGRSERTQGRQRGVAEAGGRLRRPNKFRPKHRPSRRSRAGLSMSFTILPGCDPLCDICGVLRAGRHVHRAGTADPARLRGRRAPPVADDRRRARGGQQRTCRSWVRPARERNRGNGPHHARRPGIRLRPSHPTRGRAGHPPGADGQRGTRLADVTACLVVPPRTRAVPEVSGGQHSRGGESVAAPSTAEAARDSRREPGREHGRDRSADQQRRSTDSSSWPRRSKIIRRTRRASWRWRARGFPLRPDTTARASCAFRKRTTREACIRSSDSSRPATSI